LPFSIQKVIVNYRASSPPTPLTKERVAMLIQKEDMLKQGRDLLKQLREMLDSYFKEVNYDSNSIS
jgi:hypothetical protein